MKTDIKKKAFKVTPKQIYKEIWECRNFEIDHLWQRSVFLAVFLLAIAGGYGGVVMNMLFPNTTATMELSSKPITVDVENSLFIQNVKVNQTTTDYRQHLLAYGLCWLGIIFSILWIMMAKGSKYSFEQYEKAIDWFLNESEGGYGSELTEKEMPWYGNIPEIPNARTSWNIFSPLAGRYSVSKVNCTIGIVSLITWMCLNMLHFGKTLLHIKIMHVNHLQCALFSIAQLLFAGSIIIVILRYLCLSGAADDEK